MSAALTTESFALYKESIRQAAGDTLKAVCGISIQPQDDGVDIDSPEIIIGIISLVGDAELSVFIGLPRTAAEGLVAKFAGFEVPFESPDMGDAVGELTNMFAGATKAILDARSVKVNISLPTVMRAQNIEVLTQHGGLSAKMGFTSDLGPLWTGVTAGSGSSFVA